MLVGLLNILATHASYKLFLDNILTWKPDPQSLLTVLAGVSSRSPDRNAVCLAT